VLLLTPYGPVPVEEPQATRTNARARPMVRSIKLLECFIIWMLLWSYRVLIH
jgi:hypothetical protein